MRRVLLALLAIAGTSCINVDKVLEGPVPPDNRISIGLESGSLTVAQGADASIGATVTRLAEFTGSVDVTVDGAPQGITVQVGPGATSGKVTTASLTIHVSPDTRVGTYIMTVRARGTENNVAGTVLSITVIEPPGYSMSLSRGAVTLIPGGIAPLVIHIVRQNFAAAVTFAVTSQPAGISAASVASVTGDSALIVLVAASGALPGAYSVAVVASGAGLADRVAPIGVTVTNSALQVVADSAASVAPLQSVTTSVFVNQAASVGTAALRADGVPAGVTAAIVQSPSNARGYDVTLTASGSATPGTFRVTLRASAAGVPDATADLLLTIRAASVSVSLSPASISLFPGTTANVVASVVRTEFSGNVSVTIENLPAGMTAGVSQFSAASSSATITITAGSTAQPGQYAATIRATPINLSASAAGTAPLDIVLRAAPSGTGNVILDWSRCAAPAWVAGQDGTSAWTELRPASGVYRFNVVSGKGGVAWVDGDNSINVRYMTQAELTASPLDMCVSQGRKTVTGTGGQHSLQGTEQFFYNLGGGIGMSTPQNPNFTISGVRDGTHDLVAWGTSNFAGQRGLIRRDLDLPDGASLGAVTITDTEGFSGVTVPVTITGPIVAGEINSYTLHYLTTAACDDNFLYTGGGFAFSVSGNSTFINNFSAVPADRQRASDFHYFTMSLSTSNSSRSSGVIAHSLSGRTISLAPSVAAPVVTTLPGSYKRLQVVYGSDVSSRYNDMVALQYGDGRSRFVNVSATLGYTGTGAISVSMPDLSGVSGFPAAAALPASTTGSYTVLLTGTTMPGSLCQEGKSVLAVKHTGTF